MSEGLVATRKLDELKKHPKNPRDITDERAADLRAKVRRWGQLGALLIDGRDNVTILGGNHVYDAMLAEGFTEAKVEYRTPKDDSEALELLLLHNERFAKWINKDLAELLKEHKERIDLSAYKIDLSAEGTKIKTVLARYGKASDDSFDTTPPENPVSKRGEVYEIGRHKLVCGDSTDLKVIQTLMGQEKANLLLTDPPYGVSYTGSSTGAEWDKIENDDLRGDALFQFLYKAFSNVHAFLNDHAAAYIFHASRTYTQFEKALELNGFTIRQQLIWSKHMVLGRSHYHWTHEPIIYAGKGEEAPTFYGDRRHRTMLNAEEWENTKKLNKDALLDLLKEIREASTVIEETKDSQVYKHPTQKPVRLMARLMKNSSAVDDIVLEPFAGSGSTLIAAEQLGRSARCVEFDPGYCDVIRQRWAHLVGKDDEWESLTKATEVVQ